MPGEIMMPDLSDVLQSNTCFYASFDNQSHADISRGDGTASLQPSVARWDADAGRYGGGLVFSAADHGWAEDECTYAAAGNFPYAPDNDRFVGGQLVVVGELHWRRDDWHHVVATWRNANSGAADGCAELWIDGVRRGWMENYEHRATWDVDALTIGLGQRFCGRIDEVLILDTALDGDQVHDPYRLTAVTTVL